MDKNTDMKSIVRVAGSFVAWVIGSGFATGQEVLQFFSSYGYKSYAIALIDLAGFIIIGYSLMRKGFENNTNAAFNHFHFFCGKKLGTFYMWLAALTLLFLMPVLVAGAGATLYEYYGINHYIGSALFAAIVLAAYLIGFERMIKIVSSLGPVIIAFSLLVGAAVLFIDADKITNVPLYEAALSQHHAAPNWFLSGLLYLGLNFFPGSTYFTRIGIAAFSKKELKYGSILGGAMLIVSITIMSTAIMLNGNSAAELDIPVLYLAQKISFLLGTVFSVMLVLGIFSSCSVIMWSICSRFANKGKTVNRIGAVCVTVFAYCVSLFSFGTLVGTFYPIIGYIGLIFIGCVVYKSILKK